MIRHAGPGDARVLVELIRELAEYEREPDKVEIDVDMLVEALFCEAPAVFALVAEEGGEVVGMALYFRSFSTWTGRHGVYLEDLYVRPSCRGKGIGRALVGALARIALDRGDRRLEWAVLDWNEPAIRFYRSLGAEPLEEWTTYRVSGAPLEALAREAGTRQDAFPDLGGAAAGA